MRGVARRGNDGTTRITYPLDAHSVTRPVLPSRMTVPTPETEATGAAGRAALWVVLGLLVIAGLVLYLRYANAVTPLLGPA